MPVKRFCRSTLNIPEKPGTFWIKAVNATKQQVTILGQHSQNVRRSVLQSDRSSWLKDGLHGHCVEVLLDEDLDLIKGETNDGNH